MATSPLEHARERYASALAALEDARAQPTAKQILDVLISRDIVHAALTDRIPDPRDSLMKVLELDHRLKQQASLISRAIPLAAWRDTVNPTAAAWWWFLDTPTFSPQLEHWGWLWNLLAIVCLTAAFGMMLDISSRFSSGGLDTLGAFAVIIQGMLTLAAAGGAFTDAGQKATERVLASLRIPRPFWQEVQFGFAFFLVLGLLLFRLSLPRLAIWYNNRGLQNYFAGHLTSALSNYHRALQLNPDYAAAHYNLALLYEDLQDFDHARAEYQIAVQGGLDAAYNNLARLFILDENYAAAVSLTLAGLDLAQDDEVKYDLLKNLGWARLGQVRYAEAEIHLREAISLASDKAPAHCLLAQVLEARADKDSSLIEWEACLKYASGRNPDEDAWIGMARQRFEAEGGER